MRKIMDVNIKQWFYSNTTYQILTKSVNLKLYDTRRAKVNLFFIVVCTRRITKSQSSHFLFDWINRRYFLYFLFPYTLLVSHKFPFPLKYHEDRRHDLILITNKCIGI